MILLLLGCYASVMADVPEVRWDKQSLLIDGKRVCPVMGEIHYSRVPANEWADEVRKMKQGGVTIIATYVFWNHVEEHEGVFDWSGQRNLRRFIEVCKHAMAAFLIGCLRKDAERAPKTPSSFRLSSVYIGRYSPRCRGCNGRTEDR